MTTILAINGALGGVRGNTARTLAAAIACAPADAQTETLTLAEIAGRSVDDVVDQVRRADALLLGTGVYWSSWGSPMQRFLELMTPYEASDVFLGKPVGVVVTLDSVGGMDVAARLLTAFALLGCTAPPLPIVVLSRANTALRGDAGFVDVWQREDLAPLVANLAAAAADRHGRWAAWPVERFHPQTGMYPTVGALDLGVPQF